MATAMEHRNIWLDEDFLLHLCEIDPKLSVGTYEWMYEIEAHPSNYR